MEIEKYIILSDAQLVTFALDGDSVAFETLFKRYRDGIYNICLQRTGGNVDDALDLMQETFVKVYVNLAKYDSRFTFGQWIYTIARNNFIDYVRRRRDDLSLDSLPRSSSPLSPVDGDQTPEERIISEQHSVQMEGCMAALPEKYRQMVEMRFVRELSYEEIASQLGLPLGTVKTQIHRARERLCKLIGES
ncbi:MAG: sigma-70 family RNA polymerase sigma factor [Tidjanibacter sp.]|nr:sigma-70 family RNA polymerase sigma factor [Tidjanibacter sp.]